MKLSHMMIMGKYPSTLRKLRGQSILTLLHALRKAHFETKKFLGMSHFIRKC